MKLIGIKSPMKNMNEEAVTMTNFLSLKGSTKTFNSNALGLGGRREEIVRAAMIMRPRMRKAMIRIVHAKPTSGMRCEAMIGKMMPPKPEPAAIIP